MHYIEKVIAEGGYIAEYRYMGAFQASLMDRDGGMCRQIAHSDLFKLKPRLRPVVWKEGPYGGTEWYAGENFTCV